MYRIVTLDGLVLATYQAYREAQLFARWQAGYLQDILIIEKKNDNGVYEEIEMLNAQAA